MLEVDEDRGSASEILAGGARYGAADAPSEDAVADFYEAAVERLAAIGIARYEISNFARPGAESAHNMKYWKLAPYVGFGADAHSFDGRTRRRKSGIPRRISGAWPTAAEASHPAERFFVGLRLSEGIRPTPEEWTRYAAPIHRFTAAGLAEASGGVLRLTGAASCSLTKSFRSFSKNDRSTQRHRNQAHRRHAASHGGSRSRRRRVRRRPTVNRLEARAAEIAGKEAALFVPTGTMGNTIAVKVHTHHGQEVICRRARASAGL